MRVIQNGTEVQLNDKIEEVKGKLKSSKLLTVCTADGVNALAALFAWQEVGGNIFFQAPPLPQQVADALQKQLENYEGENTLIYHTSGSTGLPKLIVHNKDTLEASKRLTIGSGSWNKDTRFVAVLPAWTAGFAQYAFNGLVEYDCTVIVSNRETFLQDLPLGNHSFTAPALWNMLRSRGVYPDLSGYDNLWVGGDMIHAEVAEYLFKCGVKGIQQGYASTEGGAPLLMGERIKSMDEFTSELVLAPLSDGEEVALASDGELFIRGDCLAVNYTDLPCEEDLYSGGDPWYKTNDMFAINQNDPSKILFQGRKNDFIKVNGNKYNKAVIEHTIEQNTNLGDTAVVMKTLAGSEYLQCYYTNEIEVDRKEIKALLGDKLEEAVIPVKYSHIEEIPRNPYGKKMRHLLK